VSDELIECQSVSEVQLDGAERKLVSHQLCHDGNNTNNNHSQNHNNNNIITTEPATIIIRTSPSRITGHRAINRIE